MLAAGHARRNFVFGLIVGAVVAAALYYAQVISHAGTRADPAYYVVLGVVLGLSIALLLAFVLTAVTLYKRGRRTGGH